MLSSELAGSSPSSDMNPDLEFWMFNCPRTLPEALGAEFDFLNDPIFDFDFTSLITASNWMAFN